MGGGHFYFCSQTVECCYFESMRAILSCLALLLGTHTAFSCIWITGTKYNTGSMTTGGLFPANRLNHFMKVDLKSEDSRIEADLLNSTNFDDQCNYSVAMMYLGRPK